MYLHDQETPAGRGVPTWPAIPAAPEPGTTELRGSLAEALARVSSSAINYWTAFALDVAGVALFLVFGLRAGGAHPAAGVTVAALGYLGWTLFEYHVHRFVFHGPRSPLAASHLAHHAAPRGTIGLPVFTAPAIAVSLFVVCRRLEMPMPYPYLFVAGAYLGYLCYGVLHHLEHMTDLPVPPYRCLQRHHLEHHGVVSANFGVSTTGWDRLFRTYLHPG